MLMSIIQIVKRQENSQQIIFSLFDSVVVGSLMVVATSLGERKIKLQQHSILHANHAREQPTHDRAEEGRGIS